MRAELDAVLAIDVVASPDAVVRAQLLELVAAANQLQTAIAARVASFDVRNLSDADACKTTAVWLRNYARLSDSAASTVVKRARLLRDLPAVSQAAATGAVSTEYVDRIAKLAKKIGVEAVRPADQILADAAGTVNHDEFTMLCKRIGDFVDPDGPAPPDLFDRRELTLVNSGGMVVLHGQLDPEGGAALREALDAIMKPAVADDDDRSPAQRRADAMADLARRALAKGDLPTVEGVRPQIGILINPITLFYGDHTHPHAGFHPPANTATPPTGSAADTPPAREPDTPVGEPDPTAGDGEPDTQVGEPDPAAGDAAPTCEAATVGDTDGAHTNFGAAS
jgi:hypothetical protein